MGVEIERRFLIEDQDAIPADVASSEPIEQGYLAVHEDGTQVRVRKAGDAHVLTVKRGSGETRFEEEIEIEPEVFAALWELTEGRRIRKRRRVIEGSEGLKYEVDVFADPGGLVIAEVEFPSEEAGEAFEPPGWFGRELTGEVEYSNVSLALNGRPAPE